MDVSKLADGADAIFTEIAKFAALVSALVRAWQTIAAANGGDVGRAGDTLQKHLTPGAENASALSPQVKV
jgi:hypothetical protein